MTIRRPNATYRKFGILAVEMETAGIYWTAQRFGKRALSILTISDHIFTGEALERSGAAGLLP